MSASEDSQKVTDQIKKIVLSDTPEGFIIFYAVMSGDCMPRHSAKWSFELYDARSEDEGLANESFRGSLKTTLLTNYFTAYQIGLHPERPCLFIQDSDPKAKDNSKFVASLIKNSKEWGIFFPSVVPDTTMGWGALGYEVMRTDMDYSSWRRLNSGRRDPTLLGVGYKSSSILGMHPYLLVVDDINNEKNTRSTRQLAEVVQIWESTIKPARVKNTWEIYNYTPWVPGDIGDKAKQSPYMRHILTAVCEDRDINKPIWPEHLPAEELRRIQADHTPAEWARMYLCDMEAAKGIILEREWLHWYPHMDIKDEWPCVFGIDYASVEHIQVTRRRDHFGMAVLKMVPGGGLIIVDGIKTHFTQGMAEDEVFAWNDLWGPMRIGVEQLGSGKEFFSILLKRAGLPLRGQKVGNKSKSQRFEQGLAPLFRKGKIWLSDAPGIPFIQDFVDEWVSWDGEGNFGDDALDAVWHAIRCAKGSVQPNESDYAPGFSRKKKRNPIMAFASSTGRRLRGKRT